MYHKSMVSICYIDLFLAFEIECYLCTTHVGILQLKHFFKYFNFYHESFVLRKWSAVYSKEASLK